MNIKILLDMLVKKGLVKGREERNRILAEMTDEVAALVLADNASQALALTLDGLRSAQPLRGVRGARRRHGGGGPPQPGRRVGARRARSSSRARTASAACRGRCSACCSATRRCRPSSCSWRRTSRTARRAGPSSTATSRGSLRERFAEHFQDHVLRREIVATGRRQLPRQPAAASRFLPRLEQGAKNGIGEAVTAWIEVDREAEAPALREALLASGRPADEEQAALLEIEDALEAAAQERLEGKKGAGAKKALQEIRKRLKL